MRPVFGGLLPTVLLLGTASAQSGDTGQLAGRATLGVRGCGTDRQPNLSVNVTMNADGTWTAGDGEGNVFSGTWTPRGSSGRAVDLAFDAATETDLVATIVEDVGVSDSGRGDVRPRGLMHRWAGAVRPLALVLTPWVVSACASPTLVERAIRARGGTLNGIARTAEADVYAGFPGTWRWRTAFKPPDRYAWSIEAAGEPNHYVYDGEAVRAFVGDHEVSVAAPASAPLTSHARFTAVAHLDVLRGAGVRIAALEADELPAGTAAGLRVTLSEGTTYRLGFDGRLLLLWLSGPANLQPLGEGELTARFGDFRRVHGYLLPYRTVYDFQGSRLADERALAVCPDPPGLDDGAFASPGRLPNCE